MAGISKTIWDFLKRKGFNEFAIAGIMGNLQAESGLRPENLQNSYEKKLGYTDTEYTAAVDNGSYTNFVHDSAGYGLAQWTYYSRKQNLLNYAKSLGASIGSLDMQLEFLYTELKANNTIMQGLKAAQSVRAASDIILLKFERPADQSEAVQIKRAQYGQSFYDEYAKNESEVKTVGKTINAGFISDVINGIAIDTSKPTNSGNYNKCDSRAISYIVMHYTGNSKDLAVNNAKYFQTAGRQASAHFFVDDTTIYQTVELRNKAWHCGTSGTYYHAECRNANSIGIEMCCTAGNYKISAKTKENAAALCACLCKKLGITAAGVEKYVVRHYDVTHKQCPAEMAGASNAEWAAFLAKVKAYLSGTAKPDEQKPVENTFKATGTAKTTANLRMRAGAGTTYSTLKVVSKGVTVEIDGTVANGWYHCKHDGTIGYMSGSYLKDIKTTSSTATAKKTHKVVAGDNLSAIAKKYGTTVNAIVIANKAKYPKITANYIVVGWELLV